MPDRKDYPRCRTCQRLTWAMRGDTRYAFWCQQHNRTTWMDHGCIDHTDLDAPNDLPITEDTDEHHD